MRVSVWLGLPLLWCVSCESDHDALARHDRADAAADGGDGAAAGHGGAAGAAGAGAAGADAQSGLPVEPPGERSFTILHGVVDAVRISLCFAAAAAPDEPELRGDPLPANGLSYGEATVVDSLGGWDLTADDLQPWVFAADGAHLAGLSCGQSLELAESYAAVDAGGAAGAAGEGGTAGRVAMAGAAGEDAGGAAGQAAVAGASGGGADGAAGRLGSVAGSAGQGGVGGAQEPRIPPPAVRALRLPTIPRGTLAESRSFLLVLKGCLGGGSLHSGPEQELICGQGYHPNHPTLAPVLVRLSRVTEPGRLGLQVVHASSEADRLDFRSLNGDTARTIVTQVVPGAVAPASALLEHSASWYGALTADATLEVRRSGTSSPTGQQSWQSAVVGSGLSTVEDGNTYALIVMGPALVADDAGWHNPIQFTLVSSAPADQHSGLTQPSQ